MKITDSVKDYLLEHGIRPSVQRIAVMNYLFHHPTHPTVEEIYQALSPRIPTLSRTTIYNTLDLLVEKRAVQHITIDSRFSRYDGDVLPHGHFLCTRCQSLFDIPMSKSPDHFLPQGFRADAVHLYLQGLCPACRQETES